MYVNQYNSFILIFLTNILIKMNKKINYKGLHFIYKYQLSVTKCFWTIDLNLANSSICALSDFTKWNFDFDCVVRSSFFIIIFSIAYSSLNDFSFLFVYIFFYELFYSISCYYLEGVAIVEKELFFDFFD